MPKISTYIISFNQAEKINDAIASVLWTDEIVLVDSHSTDRTAQIARRAWRARGGHANSSFGDLRNRATDACNHEWILSLDADERCTPAVRDEILALLAEGPKYDAYYIPRRSYIMGRWIRGSGWYPNFRQPQFFRKGSIRYTRTMHEGFEMHGGRPVGTLRTRLCNFRFTTSKRSSKDQPLLHIRRPKLANKRVSSGRRFGHATGLSSSITFSSLASSTAGPALSLLSEISRGPSIATPSAMKKRKAGSRTVDNNTIANSTKIATRLGWRAKTSFHELVTMMVNHQIQRLTASKAIRRDVKT